MKPRVLVLYYSFTHQTRRVAEAMAESFRAADCDAELCAIEFCDERYRIAFPFRPYFWPKLLRWFWPQLWGKTGAVRVPGQIVEGDYDLVCIGSPTWWLKPAMPVASFLKTEAAGRLLRGKRFAAFAVCRAIWWNNLRIVKKLARRQGGTFVDGAAFCFRGNQIQTALSFINYMQTETNRDRYCGIKIYEFGVPQDGLDRAKEFAERLAKDLGDRPAPASERQPEA